MIKLNPAVVREVFNKLLGITDKRCQLPGNFNKYKFENVFYFIYFNFYHFIVTPAELLIALHLIDPAKAELKYVIKATSLCFSERQSYTPDVSNKFDGFQIKYN